MGGLGLTEEQTKYSWSVLNDYGNMLSPSVMFVLELILNEHKEELNKGNDGFSQGLACCALGGVGSSTTTGPRFACVAFFKMHSMHQPARSPLRRNVPLRANPEILNMPSYPCGAGGLWRS